MVSLSFSVSPNFLNKYDLIKEYERYFGQKINEYDRKSAGMAEKELHYLSKYTRLLDTWEYCAHVKISKILKSNPVVNKYLGSKFSVR